MQSVILTKYGAPEVLEVKELKDVEPNSNQVRVKVHYAGINFAEIMARMKLYPGGPKPGGILGGEVSGVIDKIGNNVEGLNIGDKVMGLTLGELDGKRYLGKKTVEFMTSNHLGSEFPDDVLTSLFNMLGNNYRARGIGFGVTGSVVTNAALSG